MMFLEENLSITGLDISERSLKIAQTIPGKKSVYLSCWGKINIPEGVIEKGEIVDQDKLLSLFNKLIKDKITGKLTSRFISACLPETKTFLKVLNIEMVANEHTKGMSDEEKMDYMVEQELPKEFPFPIEEIMYDYKIVSRTGNKIDVLVGAVEKSIVLSYINFLKQTGFTPVALEIEAQSLVRSLIPEYEYVEVKKGVSISNKKKLRWDFVSKLSNIRLAKPQKNKIKDNKNKIIVIVDLGESRTGVVIFHNGIIKFTRSLDYSGIEITQRIADVMKLSFNKAEKAKIICGLDQKKCKGEVRKAVLDIITDLAKEIKNTIEYYIQTVNFTGKNDDVSILLTGGGAGMVGIDKELAEILEYKIMLGKPSRIIISKNKKKVFTTGQYNSYSTAIGLSLRKLYE